MQKVIAEFLGTFLLLNAIVGSGLMATQLTNDVALQLLINALSTVLTLAVVIKLFQNLTGAHFNPVVTLYDLLRKRIKFKQSMLYILAQILGAIAGTISANVMFNSGVTQLSTNDRYSSGSFIGEVLATFGLIMVISLKPNKASFLVPAWIGSAYFFTSSTAFANPAVTFGRIFTDSFAGISISSVLPFIAAQLLGMLLMLLIRDRLTERSS